MKVMLRVASGAVFLGVMAGVFYFTRTDELGMGGEEYDWTGYLAISGVLLLGIVFGTVYRQLMRVKGDRIDMVSELSAAFNSRSLWSSLLVSPFVFGSVYMFLETRPDDFVAFLFAFENGFFCESIFREVHGRRDRDSAGGAALSAEG